VSAEPAGAVSGCRYGPMRENPEFAATGTVAPPLSRSAPQNVKTAAPETQQMMGAENIRYRRNYERIFF
ncbi:hypothetical protein ACT3KF_27160, partial [Escherichia coli]